MTEVRTALLSVSDKRGIARVASRLDAMGFKLLSTGGTAAVLRDASLSVTDVSSHTGFPEILGGRVKTLHPKVHGGLLARGERDAQTLEQHQIDPIALLIVNLYPFSETVAREGCTFEEAVEQIDIGGPAMLRAAAKNHANVIVLVEPQDYDPVLDELERSGTVSEATRRRLAARAFAHTARYDQAIDRWFEQQLAQPDVSTADQSSESELPAALQVDLVRETTLRYGENPHQRAALYRPRATAVVGTDHDAGVKQHAGKALSFNNIVDTDTALAAAREMPGCACVIVKHANPCGAALGETPKEAYERAYGADPTSAFGGIVAFNEPVDAATLEQILERQFVEVIVAPAVHGEVNAVMAARPNVRLLTAPHETGTIALGNDAASGSFDLRATSSGLLVQDRDELRVTPEDLRVVTRRAPDDGEVAQLLFAWTVVKWVKSNAIVYACNGVTAGIGGGQTSRVDAARLGVTKARNLGFDLAGAAMASDAFFPFRDGIDEAAANGVSLVIQPGGSKRDDEVIAAANEHGMAMVFTGHRHFRH